MKILVTGACGFVGSTVIRAWLQRGEHQILGVDNFSRAGSEVNRFTLHAHGVDVRHADVRLASDFETLPGVDVVIDAAANPSVLAGVDGRTSSRQLIEHNLLGTVNVLEYCRRHSCALILLSTSRVYSLGGLSSVRVRVAGQAFEPVVGGDSPAGLTACGVDETFSTEAPVSLYGATKVASERLALEYAVAFGFPVWIDRCGVLAGAGQFSRPDQGIFAYWINAWLQQRSLTYLGFGGSGYQVRDCLHPRDLVPLFERQIASGSERLPQVINVSGGPASARSLLQVSEWCREHIGPHEVSADARLRQYDVPWLVLDSRLAGRTFGWEPASSVEVIMEEILAHARQHPDWLDLTSS